MAWTAILYNIEKVDPQQGRVVWQVLYTDGTQKSLRQYATSTLSDALIAQYARDEVKRLETAIAGGDTTKLSIQVGQSIDLTEPTPPGDPDPDKSTFYADLTRYRSEQAAITLGFPVASPMKFSTLLAQWDERFIDLL